MNAEDIKKKKSVGCTDACKTAVEVVWEEISKLDVGELMSFYDYTKSQQLQENTIMIYLYKYSFHKTLLNQWGHMA